MSENAVKKYLVGRLMSRALSQSELPADIHDLAAEAEETVRDIQAGEIGIESVVVSTGTVLIPEGANAETVFALLEPLIAAESASTTPKFEVFFRDGK